MVIRMRRRTKLYLNPTHVLIVCIVLCIGLIFVSFRYEEKMKPLRNIVNSVIAPMQKGVNTVGTYLSDKAATLKNMNDILAENEKLKEDINALYYENKLLLQDKYELDGLRDLYKLDQKYIDYPKVAARVIGKDSNNWYNVFTIDKGADDGIQVDNNVLAGNGLAGIVIEVGKNYSKVRSIIDDSSNVWGMFLKTSDTCVVKGDLELIDQGKIRVQLISKDAEITNGDEIVTAHISPKFHQGILIGYVSDIQVDPSNLTKTAYLTPVVDFERLEEVLIITELKEELQDLDDEETEN